MSEVIKYATQLPEQGSASHPEKSNLARRIGNAVALPGRDRRHNRARRSIESVRSESANIPGVVGVLANKLDELENTTDPSIHVTTEVSGSLNDALAVTTMGLARDGLLIQVTRETKAAGDVQYDDMIVNVRRIANQASTDAAVMRRTAVIDGATIFVQRDPLKPEIWNTQIQAENGGLPGNPGGQYVTGIVSNAQAEEFLGFVFPSESLVIEA